MDPKVILLLGLRELLRHAGPRDPNLSGRPGTGVRPLALIPLGSPPRPGSSRPVGRTRASSIAGQSLANVHRRTISPFGREIISGACPMVSAYVGAGSTEGRAHAPVQVVWTIPSGPLRSSRARC